MKIIHLCSDFDRFHIELSDALVKVGVDSEVISYKLRKGVSKEIKGCSHITKFESDVVYRRTPLFHLSRIKSAYKKISTECSLDCDLLHAHMLFTDGFMAWQFYNDAKVNFIVSIRNSDVNDDILWTIPWLKNNAIATLLVSHGIIFLSPHHKQKLIMRVGEKYSTEIQKKSFVLPNGISDFWEHHRRILPRIRQLKGSDIRVVCVGEICENKNQLLLASYLKQFSEKNGYQVFLDLAGRVTDPTYFNSVNSFDFVNYHGFCEERKLLDIYADADVFILISRFETFGLVYPEAMTQALPMIYTKNQGIDGYFKPGIIGYPIDPSSYVDFEKSLFSILEKYDSISETCLKNSSIFSWEKVATKYSHYYNKIGNDLNFS